MTVEPDPGRQPELRASHDDRERAAEIIRIAAGDGRLTADELDERLEKALTARTTGELAVLTADLPAVPGTASVQPKDLVEIKCMGGNAGRRGAWVVPRRMDISAIGGNVKLDFTEAVITGPTLHIDTAVRGGNLILITRPGLEFDTDGVTVVGGNVRTRPARGPKQPVILRVELVGRNWGGNVVVRPPRRTLWQWLLRRS
jgi:Domain of unknown function (DUF1707)